MMRVLALLLLLGVGAAAHAQADEDEAHRLDRARTADLNRRVERDTAARDRAMPRSAAGRADYRQAQARYARALAEWRARFDACNAGDWDACR